jgi:hypothetical protein
MAHLLRKYNRLDRTESEHLEQGHEALVIQVSSIGSLGEFV